MSSSDASAVVAALRSRHERSPQASSKLLVATIDAINETLETSGLLMSSVAYFGACMSALERTSAEDSADTLGALCTLLAALMAYMPGSYIKQKFSTVSIIVTQTLVGLQQHGESAAQRSALQCLVHTLRNADISNGWAPVKQPFMLLVRSTTVANAKLRKSAADGLVEVMASLRGTAAQLPASNDIAASAFPGCQAMALEPR